MWRVVWTKTSWLVDWEILRWPMASLYMFFLIPHAEPLDNKSMEDVFGSFAVRLERFWLKSNWWTECLTSTYRQRSARKERYVNEWREWLGKNSLISMLHLLHDQDKESKSALRHDQSRANVRIIFSTSIRPRGTNPHNISYLWPITMSSKDECQGHELTKIGSD